MQRVDVRPRTRTLILTVVLMGETSLGALTLGAKASPPAFPLYVRQALAVAAKKTQVPVFGPLRIPPNASVYPKDGTFAADVHATRTQYAISWWWERRAMPVNDPKIIQASTLLGNPNQLLTVEGTRYATSAQARRIVWSNVFDPKTHYALPASARHVRLTSGITGWLWSTKLTDDMVWKERGWTIATSIPMPSLQKPQWAAQVTTWAKSLISKVMAPVPGQLGTISVYPGNPSAVSVKWQRGRIVYAVYVPYGLSPATTVVGSLYPYVAFFHRSFKKE